MQKDTIVEFSFNFTVSKNTRKDTHKTRKPHFLQLEETKKVILEKQSDFFLLVPINSEGGPLN